jgi:hypothetical protein
MADNFISYKRFTALPTDIAQYGSTTQELVQHTKGAPPANPVAAPDATPRATEAVLGLHRAGSDNMRLGELPTPAYNPYEGQKRDYEQIRRVLAKFDTQLLDHLRNAVASANISPEHRVLMEDSMRRKKYLEDFLREQLKRTQGIYNRIRRKG